MLTVLRETGLILWRMAAIACLLMAIGGPPASFLLWRHGNALHTLHSEGIEATATIAAARVEGPTSQPSRYYFDLTWPVGEGKTYIVRGAQPSLEYGGTFIRHGRIAVNTLPLKYLAADPTQYILPLDPKNSEEKQAEYLRLAGIVTAIGLAGSPLFFLIRRYERKRLPQTQQEKEAAFEGRMKAAWVFLSLLFYAILTGLHFNPDVDAKILKIFGTEPFSIPVRLFMIAADTILYLPVIWALWHFTKIARQAHKDGKSGSRFYLMTGGGHKHLRGSAAAAWFGILYFAAISVVWIVIADMKGV